MKDDHDAYRPPPKRGVALRMLIPLAALIVAGIFTNGIVFAYMLPFVALIAYIAWQWP